MTAETLKNTLDRTPMYQVQRNDGSIQKITYLANGIIRRVYFDEWECLDDTCVIPDMSTQIDLLDLFWDDAETWGMDNVWLF